MSMTHENAHALHQAICVFTGCEIIGVEITDTAAAVNTHPFQGNTAFMLGNEVYTLHDAIVPAL